jgi:hypothetical protein
MGSAIRLFNIHATTAAAVNVPQLQEHRAETVHTDADMRKKAIECLVWIASVPIGLAMSQLQRGSTKADQSPAGFTTTAYNSSTQSQHAKHRQTHA